MEHCIRLVILIATVCTSVIGVPTTCTAGQFVQGQTASVVCSFHRAIQITSTQGIYVAALLPRMTENDYEEILKCQLATPEKVLCKSREGVNYNTTFTDTLTVLIPNVTTDFEGTFYCQLFPQPDDTMPGLCNLTVEAVFPISSGKSTIVHAISTESRDQESDVVSISSSKSTTTIVISTESSNRESGDKQWPIVETGVIVVALVCIFGLTLTTFNYRMWKSQQKTNKALMAAIRASNYEKELTQSQQITLMQTDTEHIVQCPSLPTKTLPNCVNFGNDFVEVVPSPPITMTAKSQSL